MNADYEVANHISPNGRKYPTAHAWKFNSLIYEYKQKNPFEGFNMQHVEKFDGSLISNL